MLQTSSDWHMVTVGWTGGLSGEGWRVGMFKPPSRMQSRKMPIHIDCMFISVVCMWVFFVGIQTLSSECLQQGGPHTVGERHQQTHSCPTTVTVEVVRTHIRTFVRPFGPAWTITVTFLKVTLTHNLGQRRPLKWWRHTKMSTRQSLRRQIQPGNTNTNITGLMTGAQCYQYIPHFQWAERRKRENDNSEMLSWRSWPFVPSSCPDI